MKILLVIMLICFLSLFFSALSAPSADHNWWCNQTSYPETCRYYMSQGSPNFSSTQRTEFLNMAVHVTMDQALVALNHTKSLGSKCLNAREEAAWSDCIKFYESTILQLNQTLNLNTKSTAFDIQTWLSAALTNLHTCRTGFIELNVTNNILPVLMSNNVSKLISNTLDINNPSTMEETHLGGLPSWLSTPDQRLLQSSLQHSDLVVAQDGSGNFRTIKEALSASLRRKDSRRFVIHIKSGVYHEYIEVTIQMKNIMLVGDGLSNTIISGSRSHGGGYSTFNSATAKVIGNGFIARGITFRNSAGPQNSQAVALISTSDCSVFYNCGFQGYQDTLFVHSQRQFYQKCHIYGTVDVIFGNAAVVLQNCIIHARRPVAGGGIVITAQGRTDPNQNTGISIHNCRVVADEDLVPVLSHQKAYLGRPWEQYSRTVYLQTFLDSLVHPEGWMEWKNDHYKSRTLYYGEYKNYGPGSSTQARVKWPGYQVITDLKEAEKFSVANFIGGQSWLPNTGVPFTAGLLP
ncbi:unnamed protein product [Ilex paraguariensis]|uniref:Pectinesterase inhibitor domain-containing protein n=1 Tax=Ilex paraguariensis TaxID=185542 RepID=A0ABC8SV55_9AQUA